MLMLYEKSGVDLAAFKPFLWGSKARQYYSMKTKGRSLTSHVSPGQVLELLDRDRMARSVHHFPLRRTLQTDSVEEASDLKTEVDCYDPCFLLTVLIQILGPENIVDCHQFVESRCLGYLFASLSCHDEAVRSMGYLALSLFHQHVEGSKFTGKHQVLYLMKTFRNSVKEPNMKLACVVMHFLDKALVTLCKPESHMFMEVNAFLLLKPDMNFLDVPEFYKLFNSSSFEYKQERGWMLELLTTGLRETSDYRIYQRRFVFKLLITFYQSVLSDNWCKVQILKILQTACREKTVASDLVRKEGFLTSLAGMVENSCGFPDRIPLLISVVDALWTAVTSKRKRPLGDCDPLRQGVLMLLRQIIGQFDDTTPVESATRCLSTLLSVLGEGEDTGSSPVTTLDMARLVSYYSTIMKDEAAAKRIFIAMEMSGFTMCSTKTSKLTKGKLQAAEVSQTDVGKDGMSELHSVLLRVTVRWLPSCEPEPLEDRHWLETISTICVTALKIFLNKQKKNNEVKMLLQWVKSWIHSGEDMLKCLAREISETGRKGEGHSALTLLLDVYTMLYEAWEEHTGTVGEDWRPREISDDRETVRLLNCVLINVAQSLPPEYTGKTARFNPDQPADRDAKEDSADLRKFFWELSVKTSSV
ncbi:nucleolar pre-ribosomal-associated protein 1-like [Liolophura sinensis]|uniref:nucleolar pre-ribosomal-associated protein 1-like n=1 Tax=Liolophura sinensis TaxID=3198878 RepID=UPI00315945CC